MAEGGLESVGKALQSLVPLCGSRADSDEFRKCPADETLGQIDCFLWCLWQLWSLASSFLACAWGAEGGMIGCREGRGQRCPPDSSRAPQLWAARREWIGNGCSVNLPSPNCRSALGLVLWQRRGNIPPTLLLPYPRDLWRCKFCLAFPESQFRDLCWRRPWKGSLVTQAAFQA